MEKFVLFTKYHWRKISIASIPVIYGISFAKNEYQTSQRMRNICKLVGQHSISQNYKVLVVLNPVANKKKCEKMFKKYCEPVLHIAGYAVEVVNTTRVGHAKSLMETLEKLPDIVVVAGGDGTSSEVVTGLMRRKGKICPILFLPLGERNESASKLMRNKSIDDSDFVKNVSECMLALIQGRIHHRPVIKYEVIANGYPETSKPIFGIHSFSWGVLKDVEVNEEKYWYFNVLKHYASVLITSLSNKLNQNILANIVSTPSCPGCNKCEIIVKNKPWVNVSKLLNPQLPSPPKNQMKEHKLCSTEKLYQINAKQIDISCQQIKESFFALNTHVIENISSRHDFFIKMIKKNTIQPTTLLESRTVEVIPIQSEYQTYYIDGEGYDARHIKISLLPNALKYFA